MLSLEQVKLLESKVTRTLDYVKKVTDENKKLKENLDSYQTRIEELEILIQSFKEDQSRIEDGILSALDRLNQFEDALENALSAPPDEGKPAANEGKPTANGKPAANDGKPATAGGKPAASGKPAAVDNAPIEELTPLIEERETDSPGDGGGELDIF